MKIIPPDDVIAELKKKAAEYERKAATAAEDAAADLREKAKEFRGWVAALRSGIWKSSHATRARAVTAHFAKF